MQIIDFEKSSVRQAFHALLIPLVSAMLLKAGFMLADGVLVGNGIGGKALGAIMMYMPFHALFCAVMIAIGTGGSTVMSIAKGGGDKERAQYLFSQSLVIMTILIVPLIGITVFFLEHILRAMGANGEFLAISYQYVLICLLSFPFHGFAIALNPFVRNEGNPRIIMYSSIGSSIGGLAFTFILIFVLGLDIIGAALASTISWFAMLVILLPHFKHNRTDLKLRFSMPNLKDIIYIIKIGMPTFFIEASGAVTGFAFNTVILSLYSSIFMEAYGISNHIFFLTMFIFMGISHAAQALFCYNHGAGKIKNITKVFKRSLIYSISVALALIALAFMGAETITKFFIMGSGDYNPEVIAIASIALKLFFIALPFEAFNVIVSTLFQSVEKPNSANIISLLRELIFVLVGLWILPKMFGSNGVWGSLLFAELLTAFVSAFMLYKYKNNFNRIK